jgi:DNA-binding PucR family transcriptional regulator
LADLRRAARGRSCALGPAAAPERLSRSWSLARTALDAARAGALGEDGLVLAEDHLPALILLRERDLAAGVEERRLAPLAGLTERAAERMRETALAFVRHGGNSVAMAAELHLHPQTVRYRVARMRELLGDALDDPDARFELELALRARALSGAAYAAGS